MAEGIPPKTVASPPDAGFDDESPASPFVIANALLRHRGLIAAAGAIGVAIGLVIAVLQVPRFEATAKFVVSASTARGAGAAQTDLGPMQQRDPFDYYATVLTSTTVLDAVLKTPRSSGGTIQDHLNVPSGANTAVARARLKAAEVTLGSSRRGSTAVFPVLTVRATWTDPQMAADLSNAFFAALADYDKAIRSEAAQARRRFVEDRTSSTFKDLQAAEDALREFRERNRLVRGLGGTPIPPLLAIRDEQLSREVSLQSDLYVALKKNLDQVRIAELDDASALVIVEPATPPNSRTGTARRTYLLAGAVFGVLAGVVLTGLLELRRDADLTSTEAQEFVGHLTAMRQQVLGVFAAPRDRSPASSAIEHPTPKQDV